MCILQCILSGLKSHMDDPLIESKRFISCLDFIHNEVVSSGVRENSYVLSAVVAGLLRMIDRFKGDKESKTGSSQTKKVILCALRSISLALPSILRGSSSHAESSFFGKRLFKRV